MRKIAISKFISDAKKSENANKCGMFLFHNGVVRESQKAKVRGASHNKIVNKKVKTMDFSYDKNKLDKCILKAKKMKGIYYVNVWLNEGRLNVGDDIMYVIVGGDIRPRVIECLQKIVDEIKNKCVKEVEII